MKDCGVNYMLKSLSSHIASARTISDVHTVLTTQAFDVFSVTYSYQYELLYIYIYTKVFI